jgi:branched-chain amino acid transport system permease protein
MKTYLTRLASRSRATALPAASIVLVLGLLPLVGLGTRWELTLTLALVYGIAAAGLGLFSGYSGQLAMGNFGFVAVGAYASVIVVTNLGAPVWVGLPFAIVVAGLIALVVGLPMVRLPYLGGALVTFFFAAVVSVLLSGRTLKGLTQSTNGLPVPPLQVGDTSFLDGLPLYYLSWGLLVIVVLVTVRYASCRAGRTLRLIKRSGTVAAVLGVDVRRARVSAFVFSGMTAGLAGFVYAQALGYLSPESFGGIESINLMAMVVVGGLGTVAGPLLGAIFFTVLIELSRGAGGSRELVFALALLIGLVVLPKGLYGLGAASWRSARPLLGRGDTPAADLAVRPSAGIDAPLPPDRPIDRTQPLLAIHDVTVSFGGIHALRDVSLAVDEGTVHAIIGPNGAGKTTLLNCISGLQVHAGAISLAGAELERTSTRKIRTRGISRTFQNPSLVPDLTAAENVELGAYGLAPSGVLRDVLPLPSTRRRDRQAAALAATAMDLVGFPAYRREVSASELTLAEQKTVDIARAIAGQPRLLLLDEPTAGLADEDIEALVTTLQVVNQHATILVIAHHIGFVRAIADHATVLNFGEVIATGSPDVVTQRDDVDEIYLGAANV